MDILDIEAIEAIEQTVPACDAQPEWAQQLSKEERGTFGAVLAAMRRARIPFMIGGAFAVHHYTGVWRNTKDMDLVVIPRDREAACRVVAGVGLRDYYEVLPYDREWICRCYRGDVIVDVIWRMANKVDEVDESWLRRACEGEFAGHRVRFVAPEELIWMKLFVFQRQRCDWPDIINIIRGTQGRLDWDHLLARVGPHYLLLQALVNIFDWLCPEESHFIPTGFRRELVARQQREVGRDGACRNVLLDSRPWLAVPGGGDTEENHPLPPRSGPGAG